MCRPPVRKGKIPNKPAIEAAHCRVPYSACIECRKNWPSEIRTERLAEREEGSLMWRLLAALSTLLALTLVGPIMVSAQDATPTADPGATDVDRTDVRYLLPFGPDGLNPGFTVSATVEGVCGFSSIVALDRPDAWDCISTDNEIFDPCFEPFMQDPSELGQLACVEAPFATEVTLLNLTKPLVREKEAAVPDTDPSIDPGADPSLDMEQSAAATLAPWDLPWALELANGDRCTLLHGTLIVLAGQTVHYGCVEGGMVLGETDRTQPVWTVSYLAEGESASRLVDVAVAWS